MDYKEFAQVLKAERLKRGWTRIQLYMRINELSKKHGQLVSIDSLGNWENGKKLPRLEATLALAKVYKKPELINLRIQAIELIRKVAV